MTSTFIESIKKELMRRAERALSDLELHPFSKVAHTFSRSDLQDPAIRAYAFDTGIVTAALEVLAAKHGMRSVNTEFTMDSEEPTLQVARMAMVQRVRSELETARVEAAKRAAASPGEYWAKGTGYGFDGDMDDYYEGSENPDLSIRDEALVKAAARLNNQTEALLRLVVALTEPVRKATASDVDAPPLPASVAPVLGASCFVPLLKALLRQGEDLADHNPAVLRQAVRACRMLARQKVLWPLLVQTDEDSSVTVGSLMLEFSEGIKQSAELLAATASSLSVDDDAEAMKVFEPEYVASTAELVKPAMAAVAPSVEAPAPAVAPVPVSVPVPVPVAAAGAGAGAAAGAGTAAVPAATAAKPPPASTPEKTEGKAPDDEAADKPAESTNPQDFAPRPTGVDPMVLDKEYCATMAKHLFGSRAMDTVDVPAPSAAAPAPGAANAGAGAGANAGEAAEPTKTYAHHYRSSISAEKTGTSKGRAVRVMRELRSLRTALPLNASSSIFLRYDKKRPQVMQCLITGPADTPYDSGCFLFDMYLPTTYPNSCPKINLMTTGGGTVRFNPNLYNCGKVCLSLLGTWGGSSEETWTKDSTLLQLFVSIQSLILVPLPAFNEPSVERGMNTVNGMKQARTCTNGGWERLRVNTVQWAMTDMLKNPPAGFEDAVRDHFRVKADYVRAVAKAWLDEAGSLTKEKLTEQVKELMVELDKVAPPPPVPAPAEPKRKEASAEPELLSSGAAAHLPPAPALVRAISA